MYYITLTFLIYSIRIKYIRFHLPMRWQIYIAMIVFVYHCFITQPLANKLLHCNLYFQRTYYNTIVFGVISFYSNCGRSWSDPLQYTIGHFYLFIIQNPHKVWEQSISLKIYQVWTFKLNKYINVCYIYMGTCCYVPTHRYMHQPRKWRRDVYYRYNVYLFRINFNTKIM